ncbi:MAG: hypothetical protein II249_06035 [Bacteroidaceae bacterium]|nr:hypothetical protein [Bacteroidaceae bacterium]
MTNEIITIQPTALEVLNKSEIDVQISTAKAYPRDVAASLQRIGALAMLDEDVAAECFYKLKRGSGDNASYIEGVSVRLAEIIAKEWGNIRVQSRIIGNDGKKITSQGICHDLESNYAASVTVERRITDKYGKTFSEDMQVVTGNAANAIAFRNAVLKVVPAAVTKKIVDEIKRKALGQTSELPERRQKMFAAFAKLRVSKEQIFDYLSVQSAEEIDMERVLTMLGAFQAIKEGTTTVEETFGKKAPQSLAEKAVQQQEQTLL